MGASLQGAGSSISDGDDGAGAGAGPGAGAGASAYGVGGAGASAAGTSVSSVKAAITVWLCLSAAAKLWQLRPLLDRTLRSRLLYVQNDCRLSTIPRETVVAADLCQGRAALANKLEGPAVNAGTVACRQQEPSEAWRKRHGHETTSGKNPTRFEVDRSA